MKKWDKNCSRRTFLRNSAIVAAGASLPAFQPGLNPIHICHAEDAFESNSKRIVNTTNAKVAIVRCTGYGREVKDAYKRGFDLLGGIGALVKGKTVTIKINLTGTPYRELYGRVSGESYLTHGSTAIAMSSHFLEEGAKRVRIVECANYRMPMEDILTQAGWDVDALKSLGKIELENTRNKGEGWFYSKLPVPTGGYMFSSFEFNHSYEDADVFVSLCKMKNHAVAGVTLGMKNLFGITPNARYGDDAGSEEAIKGRSRFHGERSGWRRRETSPMPGLKDGEFSNDAGFRVPRIIVDINAARPIHLTVIDGITSISGGEGYWSRHIKFVKPGVLIVGLNPVSTDAVGAAVMGYPDPRAERGTPPFYRGDNHILLAERAGLGTADLSKIDVRGLSIEDAVYPYDGAKRI